LESGKPGNLIEYWLVVWMMAATWRLFFHILGMSSSQLTFKFFKMVKTTNQNIMEVFPAANTFRLFLGVWFM
jgi:hypothetical protein